MAGLHVLLCASLALADMTVAPAAAPGPDTPSAAMDTNTPAAVEGETPEAAAAESRSTDSLADDDVGGPDRAAVQPGEADTATPADGAPTSPIRPPAPSVDTSPTAAVNVAVGLSPESAGNPRELQLVSQLVEVMGASTSPPSVVRRLRSGAATPRRVCAEGVDQLVVTVGYLPDRPGPAIFTFDCGLERELGVRQEGAAGQAGLLRALWDEHTEAVAAGEQVRGKGRMSPRLRTGLIAGGALIAIGLAVGIIMANTLREEATVITVSP